MFNLAEYRRRPDRLSDHLTWAALIGPGVVLDKFGAFQKTVAYRGPDLASSTPAELVAARARLNNALRRLGTRWCLHAEASRRAAAAYPASTWPDPVTALIDDTLRADFAGRGSHFETAYYLTFTYLPPEEAITRAEHLLVENAPARAGTSYREHLDQFLDTVEGVVNILRTFMPLVLPLDDARTLTYLHDCISLRRHPVAVPEVPMYLDALLADTPLTGGLQPRLGRCHLRTVSLRAYVGRTVPGVLDRLNELSLEYRWVARYLPLDKADATRVVQAVRKQWWARRRSIRGLLREVLWRDEPEVEDGDAVHKAHDADAALAELGDDLVSFGYLTPTITVWDESLTAVEDKVRAVQQVLDGAGFVSAIETLNAVEAWLGSLPGQTVADPRRPLLSSLNLCDLMPVSAVWAGPARDAHLDGPPLITAKTAGASPFRLALHQGDVGHTLVVGPTGAGKSVLLNLMAAQWRRYPGAQVYIFDKGASCRALTLAVGGEFHPLGSRDGLAFQPLAGIDDEAERSWAHDWLVDILVREGVPVTPEVKAGLWATLATLADAPPDERTLTLLVSLSQDAAVRQALQPYTLRGPHGHLLDHDRSLLAEHPWQAFELGELMASPAALLPVLTWLFHALERRFTGVPTLLVLDEAWVFLTESLFAAKIREWLKTLRKMNVAVVFATQSLADIAESAIAPVLIESCPTRLFLPNDRAGEPTTAPLYHRFGLNERQLGILATAMPKRQYYYQSRAGNRLFDLPLHGAALALCGSSAPDDQRLLTALAARAAGPDLAAALLEAKGLPEAAAALRRDGPTQAAAE